MSLRSRSVYANRNTLLFADLQQVFEMFDKNKDGKISCEELGVVLRTLGHRYSQTEVEEMIKNADKNGKCICVWFFFFSPVCE